MEGSLHKVLLLEFVPSMVSVACLCGGWIWGMRQGQESCFGIWDLSPGWSWMYLVSALVSSCLFLDFSCPFCTWPFSWGTLLGRGAAVLLAPPSRWRGLRRAMAAEGAVATGIHRPLGKLARNKTYMSICVKAFDGNSASKIYVKLHERMQTYEKSTSNKRKTLKKAVHCPWFLDESPLEYVSTKSRVGAEIHDACDDGPIDGRTDRYTT